MPTFKDTVKAWFETGDKPTQSQFWQLFDYLRFKDEAISQASVTGLVDALVGKVNKDAFDAFTGGELLTFVANNFYDVPAGYLLEKFIVIPTADTNLKIGLTAGGEEIAVAYTIPAGKGEPFEPNIYGDVITRVYFTGIVSSTKVIIFKRKVTLV